MNIKDQDLAIIENKKYFTSQENNIPKVWEAVLEHSNFLVAKITKIGVYTKLTLGMEYQ